ncbi:PREDICTED: adhesion G-protein coupled receptor G7-like, partial [Priapulus caudatus]|uniref:Adhesion G-protein coupled receptor G7-like n=1 Tax=Priapulus caudatus TaxID=37621 RepID=A0ABM1F4Z2_PRICU
MAPPYFYYGFLLPLCVILACNVVVLVLVVKAFTCDRKMALRSNQSRRVVVVRQLVALAALVAVMGLTWLFGLLAAAGWLAGHYLFCIFNSLQGFIIYFFAVLKSKAA